MIKLKAQTFALIIALTLLISACAAPGGSSGSSLSSLEVLQRSAEAMSNVKSSHIEMQTTNNTQLVGATTSTTPVATSTTAASTTPGATTTPVATSTPGATTTPVATSTPGAATTPGTTPTPVATLAPTTTPTGTTNVSIKGSGDVALPDQEQMKLNITSGNNNVVVTEIVQGNKVYIQNAQGQWYVLDRDRFQSMVGNPLAGMSFDQNSLLGIIQHTTITDHGMELVNGTNLRHIGAELDKEALRQLLTDNPQLQSSFGQQNIETVLANLKSFQTTVDVWIDETQFYVHRTQLVLKLDADTSSVSGAPQRITTDFNTTVDLSKFNEAVTITPPTNAIPTDNPADVLGL